MRISPHIVLLAGAVLLFAVACGDDDSNSSSPTPPATAESSASPTEGSSATPSDSSASPTREPSQTEATIGLREYSIDPEATSARPGTVTFNVENRGEITHEFLVIRTDLPHAQLPRLADNRGADEAQLDIVGRINAIEPGTNGEVALDLSAGNYVLICNLNTDSRSHYLSGMYDRFVVSDDAPEPAPTE